MRPEIDWSKILVSCKDNVKVHIKPHLRSLGEPQPDLGRGAGGDSMKLVDLAAEKAILEMHRQVGIAKPASDGLMYRGLMIRHLVMPNNVSGSLEVMKWIADSLPKDTFVNIMSQYRPMYKAKEYPEINRRIYRGEYDKVVNYAKNIGLSNLEIQGY